jgi:hypothetical protein
MAFKIKRAGKKETPASASEGKMSEDVVKRGSQGLSKDDEGEDKERDDKDPDEQAKEAAGQDLIDAHSSGNPLHMFEAFGHALKVHKTIAKDEGPPEEEGNESEDVSPMVKEIRAQKRG